MNKYLVVSVHDITADGRKSMANDLLFSSLKALDIRPLSVAFIPAYINADGLVKHPERSFGHRLQEWVGESSVIAMHGYTHEKTGIIGREFSSCAAAEASRLLDLGEGIFEDLGLGKPTVFVPPFWRISGEAFDVACDRYDVIPLKYGVHNVKNDKFHSALPVYDSPAVFSGYVLGDAVGNARTRINVQLTHNNPLVRIVLHAHDQHQLEPGGIVRELIDRYRQEGRELVTYPDAMKKLHEESQK